ncbi:hypothetical protein [Saccharopolyspora taberi]
MTTVAASVVAILGFFGFSNIGQLSSVFSEEGTPSTSPAEPSYSYSATTEPETTEPESTEPVESSEEITPTSAEFDPRSLDDISTDETPLTEDALLPDSFTDGKGVYYELVASGVHDCTSAAHMSSNVKEALGNNGCSRSVTGNYRPGNGSVLISVQVHPFEDASTAQQAFDAFDRMETADYGIFCPKSGSGSDACDRSDFLDSARSQYRNVDHRYLVMATAFYTNLTSDESAKEWTAPAANSASSEAGPENYLGN